MPNVLICDDAMFMRQVLKNILAQFGLTVCGEAENGEDAVNKYKRLLPDLVTLDITMPVMDGLGALQAIRAFDPTARIIMVSAMGQKSFVLEALKAGAKDFIVKPFQPDRVMEAVNRALSA